MKTVYCIVAASGDFEDYRENIIYIYNNKDMAIDKKREMEELREGYKESLKGKIADMEDALFERCGIENRKLEDLWELISGDNGSCSKYRETVYEYNNLCEGSPEYIQYLIDELKIDNNNKVVGHSRMYNLKAGFINFSR